MSEDCKRILAFGVEKKRLQFLSHFRTKNVTNKLMAPCSKSSKTSQDKTITPKKN